MKATIHKCEWIDKENHRASFSQQTITLPQKDLLDFLQSQVGGLIDVYHHENTGHDWIINDEGILLELPLNKFAMDQGLRLCGTIVEIEGLLPWSPLLIPTVTWLIEWYAWIASSVTPFWSTSSWCHIISITPLRDSTAVHVKGR